MAKSTETILSDLHGHVGSTLIEIVTAQEEVIDYDDDGCIIKTGVMKPSVTPAMMAQAVKFLKDNDITCDAEHDDNLNNLRDVLKAKNKRSSLGSPLEAARTEH